MNEEYKPRDVAEAQNIQRVKEKAFYEGYHIGLKEGFYKGRYPEKCLCHHEWCHKHS
jgi:hypothetical protein